MGVITPRTPKITLTGKWCKGDKSPHLLVRGTGGDPVSGIFERLTPTVGVTFLRVGVTLGDGYLDVAGERVSGIRG